MPIKQWSLIKHKNGNVTEVLPSTKLLLDTGKSGANRYSSVIHSGNEEDLDLYRLFVRNEGNKIIPITLINSSDNKNTLVNDSSITNGKRIRVRPTKSFDQARKSSNAEKNKNNLRQKTNGAKENLEQELKASRQQNKIMTDAVAESKQRANDRTRNKIIQKKTKTLDESNILQNLNNNNNIANKSNVNVSAEIPKSSESKVKMNQLFSGIWPDIEGNVDKEIAKKNAKSSQQMDAARNQAPVQVNADFHQGVAESAASPKSVMDGADTEQHIRNQSDTDEVDATEEPYIENYSKSDSDDNHEDNIEDMTADDNVEKDPLMLPDELDDKSGGSHEDNDDEFVTYGELKVILKDFAKEFLQKSQEMPQDDTPLPQPNNDQKVEILNGTFIDYDELLNATSASNIRKRLNHVVKGLWNDDLRNKLCLKKRTSSCTEITNADISKVLEICLKLQSRNNLKLTFTVNKKVQTAPGKFKLIEEKQNLYSHHKQWISECLKNQRRLKEISKKTSTGTSAATSKKTSKEVLKKTPKK